MQYIVKGTVPFTSYVEIGFQCFHLWWYVSHSRSLTPLQSPINSKISSSMCFFSHRIVEVCPPFKVQVTLKYHHQCASFPNLLCVYIWSRITCTDIYNAIYICQLWGIHIFGVLLIQTRNKGEQTPPVINRNALQVLFIVPIVPIRDAN